MTLPLIDQQNERWRVRRADRVSACDNRPGLTEIYVTVTDGNGGPLQRVRVRFDVEGPQGIAYDHMDVWGVTDENGYLVWDHLGVPTRYMLWMEGDERPLIENIRKVSFSLGSGRSTDQASTHTGSKSRGRVGLQWTSRFKGYGGVALMKH